MLIRISGGEEGIEEYLEEGHKQGREYSRDELDERVILAGDLDFTSQVIGRVEACGDRYLHITLAFKEDEIPHETLRAISEDFRKFMFSAYRDDEYNFYAEAHLPRIKSYENQKTGELVERKPHIHIVVPKVNLLSGGALNPFGLVELCEKNLDAFQEHINNKYGLASPKDNRRIEFTSTSDMIQRYKGDQFDGTNKELKGEILNAVLDRNITSYEDFTKLLGEFGATRTRNAGRKNEYMNVMPEDSAKGVNLKDYVFSREFIELPGAEKQRVLSAGIQRKYESQGQARKDPANIEAGLEDWHRFRAKEVKYVNSGNRKLYQAYRAAEPAERERMLAHLAARFYQKHEEPKHEPERFTGKNPLDHEYGFKRPSRGSEREPGQDRPGGRTGREHDGAGGHSGTVGQRCAGGRGGAGSVGIDGIDRFAYHPDRQHDAIPLRAIEQTRTINSVRGVPGGHVVRAGQDRELLLPHHAPDQLDNRRTQPHHTLRRSGNRQPVRATGRADDSVVSQVARDFQERKQTGAAGKLPEFQEIKLKLDARRLLAELSRSHGVVVDKYKVTTAADGSHRIRCGSRNLNVGDYLTKEMRLPWMEAAKILRHSYGRQLDRHPEAAPRTPPDRALWRQFQDQRRARGGLRAQLAAQLVSERVRREAVRERLNRAKDAAAALPAAQRKAALSVARMEYVTAENHLRSTFRAERAPLRQPIADQYRVFLQERAQSGAAAALGELRQRSRTEPQRHDPAVGHILPVGASGEPNALFYRGKQVRYRVFQNGDVIYSLAGRPIMQDKGNSIMLLQTDRHAIEAALRLAHAKFGDKLSLSGSAEFQERAAKIAAEAGLNVRFDNRLTEQIREQRAAELAGRRARTRAAAAPTKPSRDRDIERE